MRFFPRTGFTLIELAVVVVIASLMVGFGLQSLKQSSTGNCYERTRLEMEDLRTAYERYVRTNNRYPKPARVDYGSNNPFFGVEATTGVTSVSGVLIGSVPTTTLGLPTEYADDCWGNKYTYAVTEALTSNDVGTGYPKSTVVGNITVNSGTLASPSTITTAAAMVLVSHGEDGGRTGATPLSAADITAHSCSVTGTKTDSQNCDIVGANALIYFAANFNNGTGSDYFDDLVQFGDKMAVLPADCAAGTAVSWCTSATGTNPCYVTGCSSTLASTLAHEASTGLTYSNLPTTTKSGSVTATCYSGVVSQTNATCGMSCNSTASSWNGTASGCAGAASGAMTAGQVITGIANTVVGKTGTGTATCNGVTGVVSFTGTCVADCTATTPALSWNTNCGRARPTMSGGAVQSISNTNPSYTGAATATCSATTGTISLSATSCAAAASDCTAGTLVSWNGSASNCSVTLGSTITNGASAAVTNTASGLTGSGTANCSSGVVNITGGTCYSNCTSQLKSWGTSNECSTTVGAVAHTGSSTVSNTATGYSGGATFTCTNGVLGASGTTCVARAPDCYERTGSSDPCGTYYYTDGSTVSDTAPCDSTVMSPPSGWDWCSSTCDTYDCAYTNPDTGTSKCLTDGVSRYFASSCQTFSCCSGVLSTDTPSPCPVANSIDTAVCSATCAEDSYQCDSSSSCDVCCGGSIQTISNPFGTTQASTPSGGCALIEGASCDALDCDIGGMYFERTCGCMSNGASDKTTGMGCRRYQCNSGVLTDIGAGGLCKWSPGCDVAF